MAESKYFVGQPVIVIGRRPEPEEMVVCKVGRLYVFAATERFSDPKWAYNWKKFEIETGYEKVNYGDSSRLFTVPEFEEYQLRNTLMNRLRDLGVGISYHRNSSDVFSKATTSQLFDIIEVLDPQAGGGLIPEDVDLARTLLATLPVLSQVRCHWPTGQQPYVATRISGDGGAASGGFGMLNSTEWVNMATWKAELTILHVGTGFERVRE